MIHAAGSPDLDTLGAYLEGSLETPEQERVEEHLSQCRECRETLALFVRARGVRRRPVRAVSWLAAAAGILLATAVGVRIASRPTSPASPASPAAAPPEVPPPQGAPGETPAPEVAAPTEPAVAAPSSAARAPEEPLEVRRSGQKSVGGKTFRLVAGEWVDRDFDPDADLEAVAAWGPEQRRQLMARVPALTPFASIGDRVLVVYQGKVYRFGPAPR